MGQRTFFTRLPLYATVLAVLAGTVWGLTVINGKMTVRYQAVGIVTDADGAPLDGVEVVLSLTPPPSAGPQLDDLFDAEGATHGRQGSNGALKRAVGPTIGLSSASGTYIVRAIGRTGASHAIRLGFDSSGRPPFEVAWAIFRKQGFPDTTRTISILGWKPAPSGWGKFANRLPRIEMGR